MRSSKSRSRNKSNRQRTLGNIVNRVFDSSGPEGKVRGTPQQIIEKYLTLARDAQLSNDRVAEQSFLQHAEHYTRMLGEAQREMAERQQHSQQNPRQDDDGNNPQFRDSQPGGNGNGQHGQGHSNGNGNGNGNGRDHGGHRDNRDGQQGRDGFNRDRNNRRDFAAEQQQQSPRVDAEVAAPVAVEQDRPQPSVDAPVETDDALPFAVTSADDDDASAPVETPETMPKPRSRAPRAAKPARSAGAAGAAPRTRRKAVDAEVEPSSNATIEGGAE